MNGRSVESSGYALALYRSQIDSLDERIAKLLAVRVLFASCAKRDREERFGIALRDAAREEAILGRVADAVRDEFPTAGALDLARIYRDVEWVYERIFEISRGPVDGRPSDEVLAIATAAREFIRSLLVLREINEEAIWGIDDWEDSHTRGSLAYLIELVTKEDR